MDSPYIDLGGVFSKHKSTHTLTADLKEIYDAFTADPTADLKLDPEIDYGNIIKDYQASRKTKYYNLMWIQHPETLRFYHSKNPNTNIFTIALNLNVPDLLDPKYKHTWTIYNNHVSNAVKYTILLQMEIEPISLLLRMIELNDIEPIKRMQPHYSQPIILNLCLVRATEYNHLNLVEMFVNIGADVNVGMKPNSPMKNPICIAAESGYFEILKYLISKKASFRHESDKAFRYAATYGHLDIVEYLVSLGADVHADKDDALKWACIYKHLPVIKFLISKDANVHICDALTTAINAGDHEIVEYLLTVEYYDSHNIKQALKNNPDIKPKIKGLLQRMMDSNQFV